MFFKSTLRAEARCLCSITPQPISQRATHECLEAETSNVAVVDEPSDTHMEPTLLQLGALGGVRVYLAGRFVPSRRTRTSAGAAYQPPKPTNSPLLASLMANRTRSV